MPSFPDMPAAYQQHSLPRPVSAESNFSAAASSPSTYMTQVQPCTWVIVRKLEISLVLMQKWDKYVKIDL